MHAWCVCMCVCVCVCLQAVCARACVHDVFVCVCVLHMCIYVFHGLAFITLL